MVCCVESIDCFLDVSKYSQSMVCHPAQCLLLREDRQLQPTSIPLVEAEDIGASATATHGILSGLLGHLFPFNQCHRNPNEWLERWRYRKFSDGQLEWPAPDGAAEFTLENRLCYLDLLQTLDKQFGARHQSELARHS
ncbi:hypothetical protein KIL84_016838 [Mauremys mutica]|uniref:Uncharacterized protein n=1 Tax=Mauremys mutica TaxID=74926 RepID=A0A9D3X399_9SAUR|nr:hypothetical protein KIL84_016838 [Mauremys mutica]